jgi:hypothetical protein
MEQTYFKFEDEWERRALEELYNEYSHALRERKIHLRAAAIELFDSDSNWGEWDNESRTIRLSRKLLKQHSWFNVLAVLRHEMAHQLVDETEPKAHEFRVHGDLFKAACLKLGVPAEFSKASAMLQENSPDWRVDRGESVTEKMLEKVRKLLALATSANEHEALLAMNRVRELYAKYNLEQAAEGKNSQFVHIVVNNGARRRQIHEKKILSLLVGHFFVRVISGRAFDIRSGKYHVTFEIIGTRENALMAEYVYHFLVAQTEGLVEHAAKSQNLKSGRSMSRMMKKSYRLGILSGFAEKLTAEEKRPGGTASAEPGLISRALVAFNKNDEIEDYIATVYPRLRTTRTAAQSIHGSAFSAGQEAGRKVMLNKPITSTATKLGRFLTGR